MSAPARSVSAVAELAELVRSAGSVVVLTGAGISVPSGIPDFRSPGTGLWEGVDPMEVAHIDAFHADPERFWRFYSARFAALETKRPNRAHDVLAELERRGLIDAVITQNVDMLHRAAGTRELVEVHGSIATCSCLRCRDDPTLDPQPLALAAVRALMCEDPDRIPRCARCDEPLKPDVVLFGELLHEPTLARARSLCERADVLICIGSSLEVHPVAALPLLALEHGGALAILTQGPTPLDGHAHVRLRGDVVAELDALLHALD